MRTVATRLPCRRAALLLLLAIAACLPTPPAGARPAPTTPAELLAAFITALNTRDDGQLRSLLVASATSAGCTALDWIVSNELFGHPQPQFPAMLSSLRASQATVTGQPRVVPLVTGYRIAMFDITWTYALPNAPTVTVLHAFVQWTVLATPQGDRILDQVTEDLDDSYPPLGCAHPEPRTSGYAPPPGAPAA
jgi:hypothetical protein